MCSPSVGPRPADGLPELSGRLGQGRDGADGDVLVLAELEPLVEAPAREDGAELLREGRLGIHLEVQLDEVGPTDHLTEPDEELRLERGDREVAAVGGGVDPVAGEAAGQELRQRLAAESVGDEPVRAVGHRGRQPRAAPGARPLEQGGEHRGDGSQGTRSEIRGLHGRQAGCGVLQHARPAEVVEVVPDPRRVAAVGAEAGDRAVHDRLRHVVRADAEPRRDARAKALEHHVRAGAELTPEGGLGLQVDDDRLLAGVQRASPTPARRGASDRPRAARRGRRGRRARAAPGRRTPPAGSGSDRRRAPRRAAALGRDATSRVGTGHLVDRPRAC